MHPIFKKLNRFFNSHWHLAVLDPLKGRWLVKPDIINIPYLKSQNAAGRHILMQPLVTELFLLLNDISPHLLTRHHQRPDRTWKPGRMVIETSPANFQVWIRSTRPLSIKEKTSLITLLKADPSAHPKDRFGRCPAFRNNKPSHRSPDGSYPLSRLIWVDFRSSAFIPPSLFPNFSEASPPPLPHPPPTGGSCQIPQRSAYLRASDSETDFAYALALARRNFPHHIIQSLLLNQRTSWHNHKGEKRLKAYLARTISKAKAIVKAT